MVTKIDVDEMMVEARKAWLSQPIAARPSIRHFDLAVDANVAMLRWFMTEMNSWPSDATADERYEIFHNAAMVVLSSIVASISTFAGTNPEWQGLAGRVFMGALSKGLMNYMNGNVPRSEGAMLKVPVKDLGDA